MKRTIQTEEQIIGILVEHVAGARCADLCRKHGISEGTFYAWKSTYSGMTVSEGCHWCAIGPSANGDAAKGAGSHHEPPLVQGYGDTVKREVAFATEGPVRAVGTSSVKQTVRGTVS